MKESSANKYKTAYAYFKNGWLKQVKGQKWNTGTSVWDDMTQVDYECDEAGNRTKRKNNGSNDVETTYVANARGETKSITHNKSGDLYKLAYTRDGLGNPLQVAFTGSQFDEPYTNADKVRYSYDDTSRLTNQDWGYGDWTSVNSTTWNYDWVGNRNPSSETYNQADMLNKDNGYKYDYKGNMEYVPSDTASTRTRNYYSGDNLLSQVDDVVNDNTTSTTLTWDADQQRLKLARENDTWEMIYDPSESVPAVLLANNYVSTTTTHMYYVREPAGELVSSFDDAETPNNYYYHFDGLGNTVLTTNGSGTVSDSFTYGAWGDVLNSPANNRKPYQYVGQFGYYAHTSAQGSALADLRQLGVRFYNPEVGRFTQLDPLGDRLNWYAYTGGNPLVRVDPTGLSYVSCVSTCTSALTVKLLVPVVSFTGFWVTQWVDSITKKWVCTGGKGKYVTIITKVPKRLWTTVRTVTWVQTTAKIAGAWTGGILAGCMATCAFDYYRDFWDDWQGWENF
jgi:RHS repeat-associated protein